MSGRSAAAECGYRRSAAGHRQGGCDDRPVTRRPAPRRPGRQAPPRRCRPRLEHTETYRGQNTVLEGCRHRLEHTETYSGQNTVLEGCRHRLEHTGVPASPGTHKKVTLYNRMRIFSLRECVKWKIRISKSYASLPWVVLVKRVVPGIGLQFSDSLHRCSLKRKCAEGCY